MADLNQDAETHVIVDASPVRLGAILSQKQKDGSHRPVYYASRALTDVERDLKRGTCHSLGVQ